MSQKIKSLTLLTGVSMSVFAPAAGGAGSSAVAPILPPTLEEWKAEKKEEGETLILVVRHGKTPWNKEGKTNGRTDVALNEEGIAQAIATANKIRGIFPEVKEVVYSPLSRAKVTAEHIAKAYETEPLFSEEARLIEMNFGSLEGSTDEIYTPHKDLQNERLKGLPPKDDRRLDYKKVEDQESIRQVWDRVHPFLIDTARKNSGKTTVCVAHAGIEKTIVNMLSDVEYNSVNIIANCGAILIKATKEGDGYTFSIVGQDGLTYKSAETK